MPLNLSVGDGDFTPFLKYNAKAGRFYARADGADDEVEIVNPTLAFDMANIKIGWIFYAEGTGPEKIWDPSPTQMAQNRNDARKFKRGFEVIVFGTDIIPGSKQRLGLREFSSTAVNTIAPIKRMYVDYETGVAANPGCVPIFYCSGVKSIAGNYGTNYEPLFTLKQWVPRSKIPAFDEHAATAPVKVAAQPQRHVDPDPMPELDRDSSDRVPF